MDASISGLLSSLTSSLESAVSALPESRTLEPPEDGVSLLDVKNELLLSYLQNLTFLITIKLKHHTGAAIRESSAGGGPNDRLETVVIRKLVELRVYLEKGVRPLEGRLKYQIDKILRAADDATRIAERKPNGVPKGSKKPMNGDQHDDHDDSDEEVAETNKASKAPAAEISDLSYRPNPAALARRADPATTQQDTTKSVASNNGDGIYRPPRIVPTALPTTTRKEERERRPQKSATIDEFINSELSTTPLAEPSIGSTIRAGGRRTKSAKERSADAEKRVYEEENFVRLPKESKKERLKGSGGRDNREGYGGEEFRGLGEGADRIERLTAKKSGSGGSVLERSRKRGGDVEDGPRGTGSGMGDRFEKRRKVFNKRR